jgi:DNA invertase Pin-like site-specific DNA recombinase
MLTKLTPTDEIIVHKLDSFARSTAHGVLEINNLLEKGIIVNIGNFKLIDPSANDYREGRPKKFGKKQIKHALDLLRHYFYSEVEKKTGISVSTLVRAKRIQ